ncbi:conserved hypothetical protein [delta proteobacterium NaphS2]|nr:conserved hypothetical protein [delta proteobacterium NaphS2]
MKIFSKESLLDSRAQNARITENTLGGGKYGGKTKNRPTKKGLRN